jgi:prevent-host-death family protein
MTTSSTAVGAEAIGVRQLKNQATQIVRRVREEGAEFVITVNGEPVAVLRPLDEEEAGRLRRRAAEHWLEEAAEIAEDIGKQWPRDVSAVDAVGEARRAL